METLRSNKHDTSLHPCPLDFWNIVPPAAGIAAASALLGASSWSGSQIYLSFGASDRVRRIGSRDKFEQIPLTALAKKQSGAMYGSIVTSNSNILIYKIDQPKIAGWKQWSFIFVANSITLTWRRIWVFQNHKQTFWQWTGQMQRWCQTTFRIWCWLRQLDFATLQWYLYAAHVPRASIVHGRHCADDSSVAHIRPTDFHDMCSLRFWHPFWVQSQDHLFGLGLGLGLGLG